MGHATGVAASYMKPTVEELAQEYVKALSALTILSREEVTRDDIEKVRRDAALEAMRAVATSFGIDPMRVRIEKTKDRAGTSQTPKSSNSSNRRSRSYGHPSRIRS